MKAQTVPDSCGLVPAIHVLFHFMQSKTWMPGTIGERSDAVLRTAMPGHDSVLGAAPSTRHASLVLKTRSSS